LDDRVKGVPEAASETPPTPVQVGLTGCCPRCGKASIFQRLIVFVPRCPACGLDMSQFNVGDGAASFLILIVGAIVTGLAMWLELTRSPPWYVHALLWLPLTVMLSLGLMRLVKGLLLALEFRHSAREGHL
jgi:uncharacterized protein (DUF983 family)